MEPNQKKTKAIISLGLLMAALSVLMFNSCNDEPDNEYTGTGEAQFIFGTSQLKSLKSTSAFNADSVSMLVISIEKENGESVYSLEQIQLYQFGDNYITEPLFFNVGEYKITDFLVANANGEVLYATPKEGSSYEGAVDDALPIVFAISSNEILSISPEVLETIDSEPDNFGYISFSFDIVETFNFLIGVFTLEEDSSYKWVHSPTLTILADGETVYSDTLSAKTNAIAVPSSFNEYSIQVKKDGYTKYNKEFTYNELQDFVAPNGSPLVVILKEIPEGLIFWNRLGSKNEVENSELGQGLVYASGFSGIEQNGTPEYVQGKFGNGVTLTGTYSNMGRIRNLIFNDLNKTLDSEKGTIEMWYYMNKIPVSYNYGIYRLFDGSYGLQSGICMQVTPNSLVMALQAEGETTSLYYPTSSLPLEEWIHLALVWNRSGIDDTEETVRAYVNGTSVAYSTATSWGTTFGNRADIAGGQDANIAGKFIIDNMKIYNKAKIDFSDRFDE